jgi:hypothetical protein
MLYPYQFVPFRRQLNIGLAYSRCSHLWRMKDGGQPTDAGFLGSDSNMAAQRSEAPEGTAKGRAILDSDPNNPGSKRGGLQA